MTTFVIVARAPGKEPVYWTGNKRAPYHQDVRLAEHFVIARKAYAKQGKVPALQGYRITVEGA